MITTLVGIFLKGKQQHRHMFTYSYVGMRKNVNNWNKIFLFITVFTFFMDSHIVDVLLKILT